MKIFRTVLTYALAFALFYVVLLIVTGVVLYQNKTAIVKEVSRLTGGGKTEIGDFFNLPFILIEARNVRFEIPDGSSIRLDKIYFFYNILKLPFGGPAQAVYLVTADNASWANGKFADTGIFSLTNAGTNTNTLPETAKDLKIRFSIRELTVLSGLEGGLHAEAKFQNLSVGLNKTKFSFRSGVSLNAGISNQVEFIRARFHAAVDLELTNLTGSGTMWVSNINLCGADIFGNVRIPYAVVNGGVSGFGNSILSNYLTWNTNGLSRVRYGKNFSLRYEKLKENYLLEYMLKPGDYRLSVTADIRKNGFSGGLTVMTVSNDNSKWIDVNAEKDGRSSVWNVRIDTPKYGFADVRMRSNQDEKFPSGTVLLKDFFVMDGIRLGGNIAIESLGGAGRVTANNIRLNGGYLGSAFTEMTPGQEGLVLTSRAAGYNNNIEGFFKDGAFEIEDQVKDLPGSAAVSNIFIDFMGISRCQVSGTLLVASDVPGQFILSAGATGLKKSSGGAMQKYVSTKLKYVSREQRLEFPVIYFPQSRMTFKTAFSFKVFDRASGRIDVDGGVNLFRRYDLPLRGSISYRLDGGVKAVFNLDDAIDIRADVAGETLSLAILGASYNLKRVGLTGVADLDFRAEVKRDTIRDIRVVSRYSAGGRLYALQFKSELEKDRLRVKQFILDNQDDKMVGTGNLWQSEGRLFGQIDFVRGGKLSFSSTFDDIIGSVDLRNWFFKNFTREDQGVFVTFKSDLIGPLILPDMNASFRMVNAVNSDKFSLEAPSIQKKGNEISLKSVTFENQDSKSDLSGKLEMTEDGYILTGDGNFNLFKTLRGKMSFSYFSQTNQDSFSYDMSSLNVGGRDLRPISGGFILNNGRFTFFKKGENGLSGYYLGRKDQQEWSLEASDQDLHGNFSGEARNGRIKSEVTLNLQLYYLSVFDILRDPGGEGRISLKIQGTTNAPVVNGSLRLYRANIGLVNADTRFRDLNMNLNIENSRVIFNDNPITTSSGNFILKGYVDLKNILIPYFDLVFLPADKKLPVFSLNYNSQNLKLSGDITVSNLYISGTASGLFLAGSVTADNGLVVLNSLNAPSEGKLLPPIIENIRWNLPIRIGNGVKFSNEFIDVILKKDDTLVLLGSFANDTFTIKGKAGVDRGSLTYLGRDFIVKEGTAYFYGVAGEPYPYVNLSTTMTYRDEKNENVDVYLTFEGKVSTIIVRDFYSVPVKSRSELAAVIGLKVDYASGSTNSQALLTSGMNVAENIWFFNPLGSDLRRRLGLDLFTIRTGFLENWARKTIAGDTNVNVVNMWEGTSLAVGKYLLPNVFVQYEMTFAMNPLAYMQLVPLHSVGVDFDMRLFDFGWKYQPVSDLSKGVIYENRFELNFNRQF